MKNKNTLDINKYWIDLGISYLIFSTIFITALINNNIFLCALSGIPLYRIGAFCHEIAHQYKNKKIKNFKYVWDATIGNLIMQPSILFTRPHLEHHKVGVFGTEKDPQYPLIHSDKKLAIVIFGFLPWLLPIYNVALCSLSFLKHKNPLLNILYKNTSFSEEDLDEVFKLSLGYLIVLKLIIFIDILLPYSLIEYLYIASVTAWYLSVFRIPLEHSLVSYKESSVYRDQEEDSFTHTNLLYSIVQPLGLRFHTTHHMYPKVPYYKLKELYESSTLSE